MSLRPSLARLRFRPLAEGDLDSIYDYIARDNPERAWSFVLELHEKCELLADHADAGVRRDELAKGLRSFPVGRYVIFYRQESGGIEVVRVLHGSRDVSKLFKRSKR